MPVRYSYILLLCLHYSYCLIFKAYFNMIYVQHLWIRSYCYFLKINKDFITLFQSKITFRIIQKKKVFLSNDYFINYKYREIHNQYLCYSLYIPYYIITITPNNNNNNNFSHQFYICLFMIDLVYLSRINLNI